MMGSDTNTGPLGGDLPSRTYPYALRHDRGARDRLARAAGTQTPGGMKMFSTATRQGPTV